jgi:hypothetical protein
VFLNLLQNLSVMTKRAQIPFSSWFINEIQINTLYIFRVLLHRTMHSIKKWKWSHTWHPFTEFGTVYWKKWNVARRRQFFTFSSVLCMRRAGLFKLDQQISAVACVLWIFSKLGHGCERAYHSIPNRKHKLMWSQCSEHSIVTHWMVCVLLPTDTGKFSSYLVKNI